MSSTTPQSQRLRAIALSSRSFLLSSKTSLPVGFIHSSTAAILKPSPSHSVSAVVRINDAIPRCVQVELAWSAAGDQLVEEGEIALDKAVLGSTEGDVEVHTHVGRASSVTIDLRLAPPGRLVSTSSDNRTNLLRKELEIDIAKAMRKVKFVSTEFTQIVGGSTVGLPLNGLYCSAVVWNITSTVEQDVVQERTTLFEVDNETTIKVVSTEKKDDHDVAMFAETDFSITFAEFLSTFLSDRALFARLALTAPRAMLLEGVAGSGKKTLVRITCARLNYTYSLLDLSPLLPYLRRELSEGEDHQDGAEANEGSAPSKLQRICRLAFDKARLGAPGVVVVVADLISVLEDSLVVPLLVKALEREGSASIFVIGTTRNAAALPTSLRKHAFPENVVSLPIPTRSQRHAILNTLLLSFACSPIGVPLPIAPVFPASPPADVVRNALAEELSHVTPGYVPGDLERLVKEAGYAAVRRVVKVGREAGSKVIEVGLADFLGSLPFASPSRAAVPEMNRPRVQWEDVRGYKTLKQRILQLVEWPLTRPEAFSRLGTEAPTGILLHGPSDNDLSSSQIFSKYLGESERIVREVFAQARRLSPCILFIDELESIATKRDLADHATSTSVPHRVLSTLLNELDGVGFAKSGMGNSPGPFSEAASTPLPHVLLVAATSQVGMVDDAILRPGRIDRVMEVGTPNREDREDILQGAIDKMRRGDGNTISLLGRKSIVTVINRQSGPAFPPTSTHLKAASHSPTCHHQFPPSAALSSPMDQIESESRNVLAAFSQKETEETWNSMDDSLAKLKAAVLSAASHGLKKPDHMLAVARKLQTHIISAMSSERSRLSRTGLEVTEAIAALLGRDFDVLSDIFASPVLAITARSNKVFSSNATACLKAIVRTSQLPRAIPIFADGLKSKSKALRGSAAEVLNDCLALTPANDLMDHQQLIEAAIRTAIEDSNPLVRESARGMYTKYCSLFPERTGSLHQSLPSTAKKYLNLNPAREAPPRLNVRQIRSAFQVARGDNMDRSTQPADHIEIIAPPATPKAPLVPTKQSPTSVVPESNLSNLAQRRPRQSSVFESAPSLDFSETGVAVPKTPLHASLGSAMRRPRQSIGGNIHSESGDSIVTTDRPGVLSARRLRPDSVHAPEEIRVASGGEEPSTGIAGLTTASMPLFIAPKRKIGMTGAQRVAVPVKPEEPTAGSHRFASEARRRPVLAGPPTRTVTSDPIEPSDDPVAPTIAQPIRKEPTVTDKKILPSVPIVKTDDPAKEKVLPPNDKPIRKLKPLAPASQPTVILPSATAVKDRSRIPTIRTTDQAPPSGSSFSNLEYTQLSSQIRSADWSNRHRAFAILSSLVDSLSPFDLDRHSLRMSELLSQGCSDTHFKVLAEALGGAARFLARINKPRDYLEFFLARALVVTKSGQYKGKTLALQAAASVLEAVGRCGADDIVIAALGALGVPDVAKNAKVRVGVVEMAADAIGRAEGWAGSHARFLVTRLGALATDQDSAVKEATRRAMSVVYRGNPEAFFANLYALSSSQRRCLRQLMLREVADWDTLERDAGTGDRGSILSRSTGHSDTVHSSINDKSTQENHFIDHSEESTDEHSDFDRAMDENELGITVDQRRIVLEDVTIDIAPGTLQFPALTQTPNAPVTGISVFEVVDEVESRTPIIGPSAPESLSFKAPHNLASTPTSLLSQKSSSYVAVTPVMPRILSGTRGDEDAVVTRKYSNGAPSERRSIPRARVPSILLTPTTQLQPAMINHAGSSIQSDMTMSPEGSDLRTPTARPFPVPMVDAMKTPTVQNINPHLPALDNPFSTDIGLPNFEDSIELLSAQELDLVGNETMGSNLNKSSNSESMGQYGDKEDLESIMKDQDEASSESKRIENTSQTFKVAHEDTRSSLQQGTLIEKVVQVDLDITNRIVVDAVDDHLEIQNDQISFEETFTGIQAGSPILPAVQFSGDYDSSINLEAPGESGTTSSESPKEPHDAEDDRVLGLWESSEQLYCNEPGNSPLLNSPPFGTPAASSTSRELATPGLTSGINTSAMGLFMPFATQTPSGYAMRGKPSFVDTAYERNLLDDQSLKDQKEEMETSHASKATNIVARSDLLEADSQQFIDKQRTEIECLQKENVSLVDKMRDVDLVEMELKSENQKLNSSVAELNKTIALHVQQIQLLATQLSIAERANASLQAELHTARTLLQEKDAEVERVGRLLREAEASLSQSAATLDVLSQNQTDAENQSRTMERFVKAHEAKLGAFNLPEWNPQTPERRPLTPIPDINKVRRLAEVEGTPQKKLDLFLNGVLNVVDGPHSTVKTNGSRRLTSQR
ncbi:spermatogenesis-associated protein 5-like protein 1 [Gonapodya sp. JEL0774]|nr:spermatogenesis-associated protein 5-like protein 1 [Gonapodya sp. JEL0774]